MAIFFRNPILSRVEDALWKLARSEAQKQIDSGGIKPRKLKRQAKVYFKGLWSEERTKAKIALKVYKQICPQKTKEALAGTLTASEPSWYSIEQSTGSKRGFFLVPQATLTSHIAFVLDGLLQDRIEFVNLLDEARSAFADHAAETFIESLLEDSIEHEIKFRAEAFRPYDLQVVDVVKNDYYYLGEDLSTSQVDMVVLSTESRKDWIKVRDDVNARQQDRRFTLQSQDCWSTL